MALPKCALGCGTILGPKTRSKDHVFGRALGAFKRAFTVQSICKQCNNGMGRTLETRLWRSSFFTGVREVVGIRSDPKEPFTSRIRARDGSTVQPTFADVTVRHNDFTLRPRLWGNGKADLPPYVQAKFTDGGVWTRDLGGMSTQQIVDAIIDSTAGGRKGEFLIYGDRDLAETVAEKLRERGFKSEDGVFRVADREIVASMEIEGTITFENLQAMALIAFKALLCAGYESLMLTNLIAFVRDGVGLGGTRYEVDAIPAVDGFTPTTLVTRSDLQHVVAWAVDEKESRVSVVLFHGPVGGFLLRLIVPHDHPRKLRAPGHIPGEGRMVARYHPKAEDGGWVELWRNGLMESSSRDVR